MTTTTQPALFEVTDPGRPARTTDELWDYHSRLGVELDRLEHRAYRANISPDWAPMHRNGQWIKPVPLLLSEGERAALEAQILMVKREIADVAIEIQRQLFGRASRDLIEWRNSLVVVQEEVAA